jgi:chorismate dehydratase
VAATPHPFVAIDIAAVLLVGPIAAREAPHLDLDAGFCRRYLANIIRFDLGPRELAGLHHYYTLASELGLARRGVQVKLYEAPALAV